MIGNGKKTLTPEEAAVILGVSKRTVYRMIRKDKLSIVAGTPWRIPREAVVKILEEGRR